MLILPNMDFTEHYSTAVPKKYHFLMLEYENASKKGVFAVTRCIKIHIKPFNGPLTKDVFDILKKLDSVLARDVKGALRSMACKPCLKKSKTGCIPT